MLNYIYPIFNSVNSFYDPFTLVIDTSLGGDKFMTLPLFGKKRVFIDWGDGTPRERVENAGAQDVIHEYEVDGVYTIKMWGRLEGYGRETINSNYPNVEKIVACKSFGKMGIESLRYAFGRSAGSNIIECPSNLPSSVKDISWCFNGSPNFNDSNVIGWNTKNIKNLTAVFRNCTTFNQPVGVWDVSSVELLPALFYGTSFNQDLSNWNTSNVKDIRLLFSHCPFDKPLNSWNVSNVEEFGSIFFNNSNFDQPLNNWDMSSAKNLFSMFRGASAFNQDIGTWNLSVNCYNLAQVFQDATSFNQDIGSWNTAGVRWMERAFMGASAFNNGHPSGVDNLGIGAWDVSNLGLNSSLNQAGRELFRDATSFNQDLSGWCVQNVASAPSNFSTNTPAWNKTNRVPVWGTCPGD